MPSYMHRTIIRLLLAAAAGLSAAATANAQEQTYSYSQIDPNLYEGVWLSFDPGFDLYLPSAWYELPVSSADEDRGAFYQCGPDQKGETGCLYFQQNERYGQELEVFEEAFAQYGCTGFTYATANGIRFLEYENPGKDTRGLSFSMSDGKLYTILLSPASDEELGRIWENIRLSLSTSE